MTLIEILTVMAIMVILAGSIVVAVVSLSRHAPKKGTTGLLLQLTQGLDQYKAVYRMYPAFPPAGTTNLDFTQRDQVKASSGALWQAIEFDGQHVSVANSYKAAGGPLTDPKTGAVTTWYYYQDAWGTPICYVCMPPCVQYTLISAGEDRTFNTPDDMVQP